MQRSDKAAAVAELTEAFRESDAAVLTGYRGLTVAQLAKLRRSLGAETSYRVVKNTLTKIATKQAGVEAFDRLLEGPTAIAFVNGDPVVAAKCLRDFARDHPRLVVKGGVVEGNHLGPDELAKLADLDSREVLLSKLAGAMKASLSGAAALFQAPLAEGARAAEAYRAKLEQAGAEAEPAEAEPAEPAEPDSAEGSTTE